MWGVGLRIQVKDLGFKFQGLGLPVAQKTYHFWNFIETIKRNPKKVGLFGDR